MMAELWLQIERERLRLTGFYVRGDVRRVELAIFVWNRGGRLAFLGSAEQNLVAADRGAIARANGRQREFAAFIRVARGNRSFAKRGKGDADVRQRFAVHRDVAFYRRGLEPAG